MWKLQPALVYWSSDLSYFSWCGYDNLWKMCLHTNLRCPIILSLSDWYLRSCTYLVHSSGIRDSVCVLYDWYRLSCQDGLINSQGGREDLDETDISRNLVTNCKLLSILLYKLLYSLIQHKSHQFFILIQRIVIDSWDTDFCVCHCFFILEQTSHSVHKCHWKHMVYNCTWILYFNSRNRNWQ